MNVNKFAHRGHSIITFAIKEGGRGGPLKCTRMQTGGEGGHFNVNVRI